MDPNATLRTIQEGLDDDAESDILDYLCACLLGWITHGGFEPDWTAYPAATTYYRMYEEDGLKV